MEDLAKLLANLDRDGVTEIVIGTNRPITLRENGKYVTLAHGDVTKLQMARWFVGTAFESLIPDEDGDSTPAEVEVHGRRVKTMMTRQAKDLLVRIERGKNWVTPPKPAPAPPPPPAAGAFAKPHTLVPRAPAPAADIHGGFEFSLDDGAFDVEVPKDGTKALKPSGFAAQHAIALDPKTAPPVTFAKPGEPRRSRVPSHIEISLGVDLGDDGGEVGYAVDLDGPTNAPVKPVKLVEPGDWAGKGATPMSPAPTKGAPAPSLSPTPIRGVPLTPTPVRGVPVPGPSPIGVKLPPSPARPSGLAAANPFADDELGLGGAARPQPIADPPSGPKIAFGKPAPAPAFVKPAAAPAGAAARAPVKLDGSLVSLVAAARARGATDLHVAANRPVMIRAIGELVALDPRPWTPAEVETALAPMISDAARASLAERGYLDLAMDLAGAGRLRGNISRQQQGLKGSFRLAYGKPPTLEELNLPRELAKVVSHHQGLVVLAGPSGHGKTTTLAALVDLINSTRAHHILTIEDPVEILHPRKQAVVSQREVGPHTKSFAAALKASLREDPDVIVIGELRDRESVEIALTAAETGHLVMATMSTPSAAKTIDRLIDMFPPDDQAQVRASLAGALRGIVSQRLLAKQDGSGVVPAVELLTGVLPLASLIRENRLFQLPNLMQRGRAFGMIRLDDSLAELVRAGTIAEDVALRVADNKKELAAVLKPAPPPLAAGAAPPAKKGLFGRKGDDK